MSGKTAHGHDKLLYLDSLRGIASIVIALYHFRVNSPVSETALVANSWVFLDFFFVLSGFVIALNYQGRMNSFLEIASFQFARLVRFYPLHLTMLFVFLGIECIKFTAQRGFGVSVGTEPFTINNLESFVLNVLMLHNLVLDELTWNKPSWTLSSEFFTYIIFALVVMATGASKRVMMLAMWAVVGFSFYWLTLTNMGANESVMRCIHDFFLGAIVMNVAYGMKRISTGVWLNLGFFGFLASILFMYWERAAFSSILFPFVFAGLILLFQSAPRDTRMMKVLEHPKLAYLGTISLGTYLIHAAVWWFLQNIAKFAGISGDFLFHEGVADHPLETRAMVTGIIVLGIVMTLILAHLSYRWIEMPCVRRRKTWDPFARKLAQARLQDAQEDADTPTGLRA